MCACTHWHRDKSVVESLLNNSECEIRSPMIDVTLGVVGGVSDCSGKLSYVIIRDQTRFTINLPVQPRHPVWYKLCCAY